MSAASQDLVERVRDVLGHRPGITEKKMFGGLCFLLNGNMVAGTMKSGALLVRVGPGRHEEAKARPGGRAMHQGDREMKGFIEVTDEGIESDEALKEWLDYADDFVKTLPPKAAKPPKKQAKR